MLGILLVNKPRGISSHDAVYRVRRALGIKKVGHTGTLDPNATGLLVMGVGNATRFLQYLDLEPKEYTGEITFGVETNTQDSEGEIVAERGVDNLDLAEVNVKARAFLGDILQVPPMYSAVKVAGERLYKAARRGEEVEREPRPVTIFEFNVTRSSEPPNENELQSPHPRLAFRTVCSGGTYVRTLAADLGEMMGCGAHLSSLSRPRVGRFNIADAVAAEVAKETDLLPLERALAPMPMVRLPEPIARMARHGNAVASPINPEDGLLGLMDKDGLFAVAHGDGDLWQPECVLPPA